MTLAISSMNAQTPKTLGEGQGAKGEAAPVTGFSKLFSVLQSGQSPLRQAVRPAGEEAQGPGDEATLADLPAPEIAESELAEVLPMDGTALPIAAETGNDLPDALPVAARPSSARGSSHSLANASAPTNSATQELGMGLSSETARAPAGEAGAQNERADAKFLRVDTPSIGSKVPRANIAERERAPAGEVGAQKVGAEAKPPHIDALSIGPKAPRANTAGKDELAEEPPQLKTSASLVAVVPNADRQPGSRTGASVPYAGLSSPVLTALASPDARSDGHPAGSEANAGEGRRQGRPSQQGEARQITLDVPLRVSANAEADKGQAPLATARRSIADLGIAAQVVQDANAIAPGTPVGQSSGDQSGTLSPTSAFASRMPQAVTDAQDIARIVDRLTAARDAVQPATVAVALNHDEFGKLSLRFDQLRTGQLSVQLTASNPEVQSALAAAASQQGGHASAGDSSGGAQTQQQQGQNAGRGAQAERDLQSGSDQSDRDERQKQGGNAQHQDAPPRQQRPRDGVFA